MFQPKPIPLLIPTSRFESNLESGLISGQLPHAHESEHMEEQTGIAKTSSIEPPLDDLYQLDKNDSHDPYINSYVSNQLQETVDSPHCLPSAEPSRPEYIVPKLSSDRVLSSTADSEFMKDSERHRPRIQSIGDHRVWTNWHTSIHQTRLSDEMTKQGSLSTPDKTTISSISKPQLRENRATEFRRLKTALTTTCLRRECPQGRPVIPEISQLLKSLPMSNFGIHLGSLKNVSDDQRVPGGGGNICRIDRSPSMISRDQLHHGESSLDREYTGDGKSRASWISHTDSRAKTSTQEKSVRKSCEVQNSCSSVLPSRLLKDVDSSMSISPDCRPKLWSSETASSIYRSTAKLAHDLSVKSGSSSPVQSRPDSRRTLGHCSPSGLVGHGQPSRQRAVPTSRGSSISYSSTGVQTRSSSPLSKALGPPPYLLKQLRSRTSGFRERRGVPLNKEGRYVAVGLTSQSNASVNIMESESASRISHKKNDEITKPPHLLKTQVPLTDRSTRAEGLVRASSFAFDTFPASFHRVSCRSSTVLNSTTPNKTFKECVTNAQSKSGEQRGSLPWPSPRPKRLPVTSRAPPLGNMEGIRIEAFGKSPNATANISSGINTIPLSPKCRSPAIKPNLRSIRNDASASVQLQQLGNRNSMEEGSFKDGSLLHQSSQQQDPSSCQPALQKPTNQNSPSQILQILELLEEAVITNQQEIPAPAETAIGLIAQLRRSLLSSEQVASHDTHKTQRNESPTPQLCFKFIPMLYPLIANFHCSKLKQTTKSSDIPPEVLQTDMSIDQSTGETSRLP